MAVLIVPTFADFEAGVPHEGPDGFMRKLITVFGMNRFTLCKMKLQLCCRDRYVLLTGAFKVHLDARLDGIPSGAMPETSRIKIRIELSVQPMQDIDVECCGDSRPVVISGHKRRLVFHQIYSEQECVFRPHLRTCIPENRSRLFGREIAMLEPR